MDEAHDRAERLAAENQELRLRDANRARLVKLRRGIHNVDTEAVANASYDMGMDAAVLAAMRKQEHGGPVYELGHGGKTALIWQCIQPDRLQYYEASRSANKALWKWALKHHRKEAIKALGKAYTHPQHAAQWSRNVERLSREENK
jgi:hypothetical protein